MGLTKNSSGVKAIDSGLKIKKQNPNDKIIAFAGNPNVGKSTIFNSLTGMKQHTGNWPGKTVSNAWGYFSTDSHAYIAVDIPGTYSLMAHSAEEEVARNFICFGDADAVVVVCDATCLERNMNLVLQTIEVTKNVVLCINLIDEAKKKNISIDFSLLSERLGIPVIGTVGHRKKSTNELLSVLDSFFDTEERYDNDKSEYNNTLKIKYNDRIENAVLKLQKTLNNHNLKNIDSRWLSLRLLDSDKTLEHEISSYLGVDLTENNEIKNAVSQVKKELSAFGIDTEKYQDMIVTELVMESERICSGAIIYGAEKYAKKDRILDKIFTSKITGFPVMLILLLFIFWLTITGANYPSQLLSDLFFTIQNKLNIVFEKIGAPDWIQSAIVDGSYGVLASVVSVMLPPMAIFFPLFTLLEDSGYLPRIAYNLDKPFKKCSACGKQSLTMCMGFGCNAAGVVGCRIIDSPRERNLALLTNSFVPCNGRFPLLISLISMFLIGSSVGLVSSVSSALILTAIILLSVVFTLLVTKLLSKTVLKGMPSSFTLELPPYRKPQFGKVIVHSIFDRTLYVLGRACAVAAPAGLIIWLIANIKIGNVSILNHIADFIDPFAKLMGLDGVLVLAFILGFPANEIVLPLAVMIYLSQGSLTGIGDIASYKQLFIDNGWTWITAVCMVIFTLMHWPCSTTLLTVKKETGSIKKTFLAAIIPTFFGIVLCMFFNFIAHLFI